MAWSAAPSPPPLPPPTAPPEGSVTCPRSTPPVGACAPKAAANIAAKTDAIHSRHIVSFHLLGFILFSFPFLFYSASEAAHGVPAAPPPPPLLQLHAARIDAACPCGEACRMGSTPPSSVITVGCESLSPAVATIITASPF